MADEVDNRPTEQKEREQWYKDQAAVIAGEKPDSRDPGEARVMVVEGNDVSDYVGVDPMYQNYANETEKPGKAEEGVDYVAESLHAAGGLSTSDGAVVTDDEGEVDVTEETPEEPSGNPDASGDAGSTPSPTPEETPTPTPEENPPAPVPDPANQTEGVTGKTSKK